LAATATSRRNIVAMTSGRPAKTAHEHLEDGTFRARRHADLLNAGTLPTNRALAAEVLRYRRARLPDRKYAIALRLERLQRPKAAVEISAESVPFLVELWNRLLPFLDEDGDSAPMIQAARETAVKWGKDETRTLEYVARELRRDELAFDF
jgi:hypothetical protein